MMNLICALFMMCLAGVLPCNDKILYEKDFVDGKTAGWKTGTSNYNPGNAVAMYGGLTIVGRGMAYYSPGTQWRDYIVEFEIRVNAWSTLEKGPWIRRGPRLLFRVKDDRTYYALTLSETGFILQGIDGSAASDNADCTYIINKATSGTWWRSCIRPHKLGKFYKIRIVVQGDEATIYEDGTKLIECKFLNDPIRKGSVGIGTVYAKATVRKVKVTKIPEKQKVTVKNIFEESDE